MAKNIVICSDGTGNSAVKGRGTNVFKIFESVDLNGHRFDPQLVPQIAIYDDGVGTEDFKPLKIVAGATSAATSGSSTRSCAGSTTRATGSFCSGSAAARSPFARSPA